MTARRSILPPLIFGIVTTAILLSLGVWQLRRMERHTIILNVFIQKRFVQT